MPESYQPLDLQDECFIKGVGLFRNKGVPQGSYNESYFSEENIAYNKDGYGID